MIHNLVLAKKSGTSEEGEIDALQTKEKALNKELGDDKTTLSTDGGELHTDNVNIKSLQGE